MNRTEQKRERKQSVRILAALLAVCVLSACSGSSTQSGGATAAGANGRIEGEGFASAEEAAKAYIEGFIASDIDAMLGACAVESYVDHFDLEKQIEYVGGYNLQPSFSSFAMPPAGETARRYNIEGRRGSLTMEMRYRYYYLVQPELVEQLMVSMLLPLEPNDSAAQFMEKNFRMDESVLKGIRIVSVEELPSLQKAAGMTEEQIQKLAEMMEGRAVLLGADEVAGLALLLDIAGTEYYFTPDLVRYGEKWYFNTSAGLSAAIFQIPVTNGGLIPADEVK